MNLTDRQATTLQHRWLQAIAPRVEEQPEGWCSWSWVRTVVGKDLRVEKGGASMLHKASKGIIVSSCHQETVDFYFESTPFLLLLGVVGDTGGCRALLFSSPQIDYLTRQEELFLQARLRHTAELSREL